MTIYESLRAVYNPTVRDRLPLKKRSLGGVQVRDVPLFDLTADHPYYKIGLTLAIHDHISDGDYVETVGVGHGVSTVHILRAGAVKVRGYEGAPNMIHQGEETIRRNIDGEQQIELRNAIVGEPVDVYGDYSDVPVISPSDLSDADVLVLDCEGAERSILTELGTDPDTVICETHPSKGAPTNEIVNTLNKRYKTSIRSYEFGREDKSVVVGELKR